MFRGLSYLWLAGGLVMAFITGEFDLLHGTISLMCIGLSLVLEELEKKD